MKTTVWYVRVFGTGFVLTSPRQIGTPLPPLEKSKDTGEFVPLWKQEVYFTLCSSLLNI